MHMHSRHTLGQPHWLQCTCPPASRSITSARSQHQQRQQQRPPPLQSASRAAASHRSSRGAATCALGDPSSSNSRPLQPPPPSDVNLSGLWAKDAARSDLGAYERSLDLLGLSGLQRATAKLIDGIEIRQDPTTFTVSFVTVVPFFKVTERFPLSGSSQLGRRDLRSGRQTVAARRIEGGVAAVMSWGEPLAGSLNEEYTLLSDGSMQVRATTTIGSQTVTADSIYTRSSSSKEELLRRRQAERG